MTKPKPGAKKGRPPVEIKRDHKFNLRLTAAEDAIIREGARRAGAETTSELGNWVRAALVECAMKEPERSKKK